MVYDLSGIIPFVIGLFVVAAMGVAIAVVALASLILERRHPDHPVVAISAAHPDTAAATRRAA